MKLSLGKNKGRQPVPDHGERQACSSWVGRGSWEGVGWVRILARMGLCLFFVVVSSALFFLSLFGCPAVSYSCLL